MARNAENRGVEILRFLARRESGGEGAPSLREISAAVGFKSSRSAYVHLQSLEEAGCVEREGGRARGVRLTERGWEAATADEVRILGRIAAGRGLEAVLEGEAYSLVTELFGSRSGKGRYLLRVVGQSMARAGIEEGDLLVVEEDDSPPDGTIVVALVEGGEEVMVKRLRRQGDLIILRSENEGYEDIKFSSDAVLVQGRVVYVIHSPRS
jgi:repressor LexA